MKRGLLLILASCICSVSVLAQNKLWSDAQRESVQAYTQANQNLLPKKYRLIKLNRVEASDLQRQAPLENISARQKKLPAVRFDIPLPEGGNYKTAIAESPILSAELQAKFPSIKTYELTNTASKTSAGRLTITPQGVSGLLFTEKGNVYISPLGKEYPDVHMVYYIKDITVTNPVLCQVKEELEQSNIKEMGTLAGDCQLRTYRLAVAATGEYYFWAGESQANALGYITTTVNDVTAIYERDATIRFTLVTNNSIIYTDSTTDPYAAPEDLSGTHLTSNDAAIDAALGVGNYDLGIVFHYGWNGGLAQLSSVCTGSKGRAGAGLTFGSGSNPTLGPQGPIFVGTVAHEIGHQFSATHTHAATNGFCGPPNVTAATAYEPGGGSTIMAYTNVCNPNFFQAGSDLYFHGGNILQIQTFATGVTGSSCPVITASGNTPPTVSTFASTYTIPISTPFILSANGNDADGNTLTYTFDQVDGGFTTALAPQATNVAGPNFRSYPPSTENQRVFPRMQDIVAGISPAYEVLPSVARTMNFQVMVRDNATGAGCTDEDNIAVTTDASAGPFTVTSQNTATSWTANGSNTATINWNVANTNAAPVNCANVSILFSIDGGLTYPYTLIASTANDGSENIIIPNLPTAVGRVMVRSINNIFFNINTAFITITSSCAAEGATVDPATLVSEPAGDPALALSLNPQYGSVVNITGTLAVTDPAATLAVNNLAPGSCINFGNEYRYDTYRFTVNVAGSYTFTKSGPTSSLVIFNLYNGDFTPGTPCANLINSNGTYDGVTVNRAAFSATLTPGIYYTMAVGTFSNTQPTKPANYTVVVTPPGGGALYSGTPDPGAGFSYAYIIVNNTSGDIVAVDPAPGPDLSNSGTFPTGSYTIYGLSYSNSVSLATLNGYIGQLFTTLQNDILFNPSTLCSNLSKNTVPVSILATLPVQLLPLEASKVNTGVLLKWGTTSEQNSSHFEVVRSADGVNFNHVAGTIPAQGNSENTVYYTLTDNSPEQGVNYYRVRELDKDGRVTLSNVVSITISNIDANGRVAIVYPNPTKSMLTLEYLAEKREDIRVKLLDSKGAVIRQLQLSMQAGRNLKSINVNGLAKGVYALQTTGAAGTVVTRCVKE